MSSLQPWVTSFIEALHVIGKMSVPFGKLLLFPWLWDLASIVIIGNSTEVTWNWHTSVTHAKESWNMSKLKDVPTLSIKSCFNTQSSNTGLLANSPCAPARAQRKRRASLSMMLTTLQLQLSLKDERKTLKLVSQYLSYCWGHCGRTHLETSPNYLDFRHIWHCGPMKLRCWYFLLLFYFKQQVFFFTWASALYTFLHVRKSARC